jgi:hypothetical protein
LLTVRIWNLSDTRRRRLGHPRSHVVGIIWSAKRRHLYRQYIIGRRNVVDKWPPRFRLNVYEWAIDIEFQISHVRPPDITFMSGYSTLDGLRPHKSPIASPFPNENFPSVILPALKKALVGDSTPDSLLWRFEPAEPLNLRDSFFRSWR